MDEGGSRKERRSRKEGRAVMKEEEEYEVKEGVSTVPGCGGGGEGVIRELERQSISL